MTQYFVIKILIIPPETSTHTNGLPKELSPSVHRITTQQSSITATSNNIPIFVTNPTWKPFLIYNWLELFLNEIEIFVAFSSHHVELVI